MSGGENLSERKKQILKAVIDAHIRLGEPVGSKYLTGNGIVSCSSATIRNEMAELESLGYLEQPHTSAGRVPSEAGYRFYVDWLLEQYRFTAGEIERLREAIKKRHAEMDSILEAGAKLAGAMTNYTALAVRKKPRGVTCAKIEVVRIDAHNLVIIIMTSAESVRTRHMKFGFDIDAACTAMLSELLNATLVGLGAADITLPIMMQIERRMGEYDFIVSPVVKAICEELSSFDGEELSVEGVNRLLAYPEYADIGRFKELLAMLEEKSDVARLIDGTSAADGKVHVYIGSENTVKIMEGSTLVLKALKGSSGTVGAIGIIGPVRMDYSKVISVIDNLTSQISDIMSDSSLPPGVDTKSLPEGAPPGDTEKKQ